MRRNGEDSPLWGGSGFCGALWRRVNRATAGGLEATSMPPGNGGRGEVHSDPGFRFQIRRLRTLPETVLDQMLAPS